MGHILLSSVVILLLVTSCAAGEEVPRGGETRPTLNPAYFTGKEARAYRAAKEIPEVLDSLYCYCDCQKHSAHKSLLTCFVDLHAKYCDVCMDEAIMAYELHKDGNDIPSIKKKIDSVFSAHAH
jgi:hypothetical protein